MKAEEKAQEKTGWRWPWQKKPKAEGADARKWGDLRWWIGEPGKEHETVHEYAVTLAKRDGRRQLLRAWRDVYVDEDPGVAWFDRDRKARFNCVGNACDSVFARMSKARPKPWIVTVGGQWSLQQRAKLLNQWTEGEFERLDAYDMGERALMDAITFGTGILYPHHEDGRPSLELIWVGDMHTDPREERNRCVKTMYRTTRVDRAVLRAAYKDVPGAIEAIAAATDGLDDESKDPDLEHHADLVLVVEAWRLPHGGCPGRHCITLSSGTLLSEKYDRPDFPWVEIRWSVDPLKYWGVGLVAQMAGVQSDLNRMSQVIGNSYDLMAPSVWIPRTAKVERTQIGNEPWLCYVYDGAQIPIFNTPKGISEDFVLREETLIRRGYEMHGISQLSAQSTKPAGLNSGKALIVHQDVESERFLPQSRAYERLYVELAKRLIACAEEIANDDSYGEDRASKVRAMGGKRYLEAVDFDDAKLSEDEYRVRVTPASNLSRSPSGRLQEIQQMAEMQIIKDPDELRELLDFPDLDRYNTVQSAGRDLANKLIERALQGKDAAANPYMPLAYALKQATLQLDLAEIEGAPQGNLDKLRNLIGQIETLMRPPEPEMPATPAPGPMMGPPGGGLPVDPSMGIGAPPPAQMMPPLPMTGTGP